MSTYGLPAVEQDHELLPNGRAFHAPDAASAEFPYYRRTSNYVRPDSERPAAGTLRRDKGPRFRVPHHG